LRGRPLSLPLPPVSVYVIPETACLWAGPLEFQLSIRSVRGIAENPL